VNILTTQLYESQLKGILQRYAIKDFESAKKFKIYLDAIIINIPTKALKYKKSIYFDDENIRDVVYENFLIPFYKDEKSDTYLILAIIEQE